MSHGPCCVVGLCLSRGETFARQFWPSVYSYKLIGAGKISHKTEPYNSEFRMTRPFRVDIFLNSGSFEIRNTYSQTTDCRNDDWTFRLYEFIFQLSFCSLIPKKC